MDIIFNCPHCEQEMAVDSSGAGSEIQCPSCGQKITIPAAATPPPESAPAAHADGSHQGTHSIASSAAAKVEMHLKVPVRDKPGEVLIAKSETAAGGGGQGRGQKDPGADDSPRRLCRGGS